MKLFATLALAAMTTLSIGAHAADAAKPASAPATAAPCATGELGGVVTSTKMQGATLVIGFKKAADNIRIRKKDDAAQFDKLSKLKVGDTHCYPNDGS